MSAESSQKQGSPQISTTPEHGQLSSTDKATIQTDQPLKRPLATTSSSSSLQLDTDLLQQQKKVSCMPCRDAKVKCVPSLDHQPCIRCVKLDKQCFFKTHKRGRKPGKVKLQQIQRRLEILDRTLVEIKQLNDELKDPDAESLIRTLQWQLHRSKFFSKRSRAAFDTKEESIADSASPFLSPPPYDGANDSEATFTAEATSLPVIIGSGSGSGSYVQDGQDKDAAFSGGVSSDRLIRSKSVSSTDRVQSHSRASMDVSATRSRSDFNMLVDMEDHASVARVPDEIQTLSNPLKLLAQASDDSRHRNRGDPTREHRLSHSVDHHHSHQDGCEPDCSPERKRQRLWQHGEQQDNSDHSHHEGQDRDRDRDRDEEQELGGQSDRVRSATAAPCKAPATGKSSGGGKISNWANTYFSRGAFHPIYDNLQEFDPIDQGILTVAEAERLIDNFYKSFATFVHIFDPNLSTITYIRKHSAFLLTVLCAVSAEFEADSNKQNESAKLAVALRQHAEEMMPAITCGDYKNVEMAQGFFVLASYQPMADSAMCDQTWTYLGNAIRIATELGCNLCCYSYSTPKVHQNEHYQRQLRNTERLWINLWIFERTLASQTGQRFHLSEDGVIATCSSWHRQAFALPQDEALVAFVELRRIMTRHSDHFNTHILRSLTARLGSSVKTEARLNSYPPAHPNYSKDNCSAKPSLSLAETQQLCLQLEFFRTSVHMDLKRWEERWLLSTSSLAGMANTEGDHPTPLQVTGALFLDYAALVTYSLPLPIRYTVNVSEEMEQLYRHCYSAATSYMSVFADRCQRGLMLYINNSSIISTVYCTVFALDLYRRAPQLTFIRPRNVERLARNVPELLQTIGTSLPNRKHRAISAKYSDFLLAVLDRRQHDLDRITLQQQKRSQKESERDKSNSVSLSQSAASVGLTELADGSGLAPLLQTAADFSPSIHPLSRDGNSSKDVSLREQEGDARVAAGYSNQLPPIQPTSTRTVVDNNSFPASASARSLSVAPVAAPSLHNPIARYHHPLLPFHPNLSLANQVGSGEISDSRSSGSGSGSGENRGLVNPFAHQEYRADHHPHRFPHHHQQQRLQDPLPTQAAATEDLAALDQSWSWMMSDLDFFQLDGGDPIMDQMGRLFG